MDGLLREFLLDVTEALDAFHVELCRFERNLKDARTLTGIFRQLHTIKGAAGFLALRRLEALAHAAESLVGRLRDGGRATRAAIKPLFCTSVRIRELILVLEREGHEPEGDDRDLIGSLEQTARVRGSRQSRAGAGAKVKAPRFIWGTESGYDLRSDAPIHSAAHSLCGDAPSLAHLSAIVGELGIAGGELTEIAGRIDDDDLKMRLQDLAGIVAALQSAVTRARTQPVRNAWRALPRIVRELGVRLGKDIQVEILGGETELDRRVLDAVKEPLLHLARNAADHGLETREERRARAKPETGVIRFSATCAADHATIAVSDDGRGLESEKIRGPRDCIGTCGEVRGRWHERRHAPRLRLCSRVFNCNRGNDALRPRHGPRYCAHEHRSGRGIDRGQFDSRQGDHLHHEVAPAGLRSGTASVCNASTERRCRHGTAFLHADERLQMPPPSIRIRQRDQGQSDRECRLTHVQEALCGAGASGLGVVIER